MSCGSYPNRHPDLDIVYQPAPPVESEPVLAALAFSDFKCFSCHPSSAPAIPSDELGFKSSAKVKARILDGSMPPGSPMDKSKVNAYFN